jgi:hypothetical protein
MPSKNLKILIFAAWTIAVVLVMLATGTRSVPNWIAGLCLAFVPPMVVQHFWRFPERTISQRIFDARR